MKFLSIPLFVLISSSVVLGQTVWNGYAYVSGASTVTSPTWYDMSGDFQAQDLQNANLGSFTNHLWFGGQIMAWPGNNVGDDVANAGLSYNIYAGTDTSNSTSLYNGLISYSNQTFEGNNERWGTDASGSNSSESAVNLINEHSIAAGNYRIVTYASATTTWGGTAYDSNDSSNYLSTFTVVPEPATMSLFFGFLSILYVAVRRR
jgi:hypothetical protein